MRHRYLHLDPELLRGLKIDGDLRRLFQQLLLVTGGDTEEAMAWMRYLQEQGRLDPSVDLEAFFESLEEDGVIGRAEDGTPVLTGAGERRLRKSAFEELFANLSKGGPGHHPVTAAGEGVERLPETRPYSFGDDVHLIDPMRSVHNALTRTEGTLELREEDLEVYETEHSTACATVLAIDISHSMILYGEDRITPARKVALALAELVQTRYAKDDLEVILFGDEATRVSLAELPYIAAGPYHTNTREALQMARGILSRKHHINKQIIMITDGKPSAIRERGTIYKNPFGLDLKIVNLTLEEADLCRRQKIVITTFMLATDPTLTDFVEKLTRTNRGRAFFASPYNLGEFVLADYIGNRRRIVR
ncbi:MAG: VWA domain-containing protein [Thermoanaerobaculia bacterium]|nr:VWA domain-containing protein [Thermoanaerobaculia bacterium]